MDHIFIIVIERDNSGRIKEKTETVNGVTENFKYSYDPMGRLLTVHKDDVLVEEYSYEKDSLPYGLCSYEMNTRRGIIPDEIYCTTTKIICYPQAVYLISTI